MKNLQQQDEVVIRLCGDSGDGIQLIGAELAAVSALFGNDIGTLPDYPAEIRAPKGTIAGVSGFQLNIGSYNIHTPGDQADCLVAMNPAALKSNLHLLKDNGVLIVDTHSFNDKNLKYANYDINPLEDASLDKYQLIAVDITGNIRKSLEALNLPNKYVDKTRNFYAYGMVSWLYDRNIQHTIDMIRHKFKKDGDVIEANLTALQAGYTYCDVTEISISKTQIAPAKLQKGRYRSVTGNKAVVLGIVTAAKKNNLPVVFAGYPITPASDIIHDLVKHQEYGVTVFQAEDEIAAMTAAIGAAFAGSIAVTASSGPGMSLKSEALGLAVMTELPMLIVNVQRGGPSTGLPTKTEQSDLFQALFGRHGEAPIPVIAAYNPSDAFNSTYEAIRIAMKYRTPVILLTDSFIANGAEPWLIPDWRQLPDIKRDLANDPNNYKPYQRDPETYARQWAIPGMQGFEHRIGGLEKKNIDGHVNYMPENHDEMVQLRLKKIKRIVHEIPPLYRDGENHGALLVIGWGSTYGAIRTAIERIRKNHSNAKVTHVHLKWLNPINPHLDELIKNFNHVIVPEINMGQLVHILRDRYLIDIQAYNHVKGLPFSSKELEIAFLSYLGAQNGN